MTTVPFACISLPSRPEAVPRARHAMSAVVPDGSMADDGRLLLSEAVANAVAHTDSRSVRVLIRHQEDTGEIMCAVRDSSTRVPTGAPRGGVAGNRESGRGLHLIETLSDDWGHLVDSHGKWTWFRLAPGKDAA
ncbi:ATP-binding protein [Streptomyces sp. NBC_00316]|uniref:ATP-binding protein n=1 Tax=Streptomyces sp. NBC_00316 TaxID=2975710 RepID=UPI002E2C550F|nr:ATP-binding protein [Streptomyces sp. NBC_00316]